MKKTKIDLKKGYKNKSEFYTETNKEESNNITNAYDLDKKGNFCSLKD